MNWVFLVLAAVFGASCLLVRSRDSAKLWGAEVYEGDPAYSLAWLLPLGACFTFVVFFVITSWPAIIAIVAEARAK